MEQVRINGIFRAKPDNVVSMHTFHGVNFRGGGMGGKQPRRNLPGESIPVTVTTTGDTFHTIADLILIYFRNQLLIVSKKIIIYLN